MKVTYIGPYDAVDVAHLVGVKQGESVEVSAELGKSLLEQGTNWQPAKPLVGNKRNGDPLDADADGVVD